MQSTGSGCGSCNTSKHKLLLDVFIVTHSTVVYGALFVEFASEPLYTWNNQVGMVS